MLQAPAAAGVVLSVDVDWNETQKRYGALHMQVYTDDTLLLADYTGCQNRAPDCGDGSVVPPPPPGSADDAEEGEEEDVVGAPPPPPAGTACRCIRRDIEQGRPPWLSSRAEKVYDAPHVVYETVRLLACLLHIHPRPPPARLPPRHLVVRDGRCPFVTNVSWCAMGSVHL